jgi:DNA recombination protein RmuC
MPEWVSVLAAAAAAIGVFLFVRVVVRRRLENAATLARAEARGELATAQERLRGREEQLAAARGELESARAKADELARRESDLRARLAETETRLAEEREQSTEKLALLAAAETKLADAFARLSRQALDANADSFLQLARQTFEKLQTGAQGDLDQRKQGIESLLAPLREQLTRYEQGVRELERSREQAYGTLSEQVRGLTATQEGLLKETGRLVTALRRPEVRGSWGEVQLRRAVEFAGMLEYVDFTPQESVETDEGRLRPDLVVRLPGDKRVVVDAKAPLDAYLAAVEAPDDEARRAALVRHARQVRTHLGKLAEKRYWDQFDTAPDFVVLFLPGESFFAAALEQDPALIEDAFRQSVLIATPATLVALLKTVFYGWRQESLAANAREISSQSLVLYDRIRKFAEHLDRIGRGLETASKAFNEATTSFNTRVTPQGRRLEALNLSPKKRIEGPKPVLQGHGGDSTASDGGDADSPSDPDDNGDTGDNGDTDD